MNEDKRTSNEYTIDVDRGENFLEYSESSEEYGHYPPMQLHVPHAAAASAAAAAKGAEHSLDDSEEDYGLPMKPPPLKKRLASAPSAYPQQMLKLREDDSSDERNQEMHNNNPWVARLAYSLRSPAEPYERKKIADRRKPRGTNENGRQSRSSKSTRRKHSHLSPAPMQQPPPQTEQSYLLPVISQQPSSDWAERPPAAYLCIDIATTFLQDYEASRPATLPSNFYEITPLKIYLYRIRHSLFHTVAMATAASCFFLSSALEGANTSTLVPVGILNALAIAIVAADIWIQQQFVPVDATLELPGPMGPHPVRRTRSFHYVRPLCLVCLILGMENLGWLFTRPEEVNVILYSSVFKPILLFYISSHARDALYLLRVIVRPLLQILVIQLILILCFAAVACWFFSDYGSFERISTSWVTLYELSTSVGNPGLWLDVYANSSWSAVFFIFYNVFILFFSNALVLSFVFQTYVQAAREINDRIASDKEDAIHLAFLVLQTYRPRNRDSNRSLSELSSNQNIPIFLVRETLKLLRPHYNSRKIDALVDIVDPNNQKRVDFPTFRTKMRQALNVSIRTARVSSKLATVVELSAMIISVVNFLYVILISSIDNPSRASTVYLACIITIMGLAEVIIRFNPFRSRNYSPISRFDIVFDGAALTAAIVSCLGICILLFDDSLGIDLIFLGRTIDVIRVTRFFPVFRDVVRKCEEAMIALIGPVTLIMTMMHVFNYIGMALWNQQIVVTDVPGAIVNYDLNNFNTYLRGIVTMFQVLLVNDWQDIANVFLFAARYSSFIIVYSFFIISNLLGVSILTNIATVAFVESFVAQKSHAQSGREDKPSKENCDIALSKSQSSSVKRVSSFSSYRDDLSEGSAHDADSEGSSEESTEPYEFDFYRRQSGNKAVQTVFGQHEGDYAKQICSHLETFESLIPGREKVGYLVCSQQSMHRYGNRRFQACSEGYIGKRDWYAVASKHLQVSAKIMNRQPNMSLFVARIVPPDN